MFQAGSFSYNWLLSETHMVLKKQLKAEKQELMLVAGAIAGLASALSVCKVCVSAEMLSSIGRGASSDTSAACPGWCEVKQTRAQLLHSLCLFTLSYLP